MKEEIKETGCATLLFAYWWVVGLVVILATTIGWLYIRPWILSLETKGTRQQLQYVDSQREKLVSLMTAYQKLDSEIAVLNAENSDANAPVIRAKKAQQKGILDQMRMEAVKIDAQFIPPAVAQFLATH